MNKIPCILLVDDDETTNYVNTLIIKKSGIVDEIMVALNGQQAHAIIQNHFSKDNPERKSDIPLIVLLDINMPIMDGLEFMEFFDSLEDRIKEKVTVIVLTTSSHPNDLEKMYEYGVQGFINKPLQREELEELANLQ
ncbi:response regulator [Pontibacter sp. FD36]|uniref:response regulator n=1 Tax=Pontibacter sp. FD36 TaxID=2789860 RepID=UPI0018AB7156|nr:response regulator [Pontibacter sp. FD36]MBF8965241.1 response regulator [Pontibacter sp. FD36]